MDFFFLNFGNCWACQSPTTLIFFFKKRKWLLGFWPNSSASLFFFKPVGFAKAQHALIKIVTENSKQKKFDEFKLIEPSHASQRKSSSARLIGCSSLRQSKLARLFCQAYSLITPLLIFLKLLGRTNVYYNYKLCYLQFCLLLMRKAHLSLLNQFFFFQLERSILFHMKLPQ